ncbi:MAG: SpoIIE family protein phosphatase [Actinomycetota bacterium]
MNANIFVPADRRRLLLGIVIAVVGPLAVTPLVYNGPLATVPGTSYLLAVVLATIFGRLVAAAIAIPLSIALLQRYAEDLGTRSASGADADLWATTAFVLVAGIVVFILTRREAVHDAQTEEGAHIHLLARAGDALSESLDVEETLRRLGDVVVPLLADWFSVELVEDGVSRTVVVMHPDPAKVEFARELQQRFPTDPDAPSGAAHVIRTGISELTETIPDEMLRALIEDPDLLETIDGLGLRCAMTVPLTARGKTFGAITLIGAETHERYDRSDLELAEEIAHRAATAIDTARLFAAETEARTRALEEMRRNGVLTNVTAAFGRASTLDEVISAMLDEGIRAAGASAATVGLVEDGGRVSVRGLSGYEPDDHPYWHAFDLDDVVPMSEAIREARAVVVATTAERDRRYPSLIGAGEQEDHALACVPLLLGGEVIGAFSASYPPATDFGEDDLGLLGSIGEQCAQAIDRARARAIAMLARDRLDMVAAASQALAGSLDLDDTIATIMRLATQHLGTIVRLVRFTDRGSEILGQEGELSDSALAQIEDILRPERLYGHPYLLVPEDAAPPEGTLVLPLGLAGEVVGALVLERSRLDMRSDDLGFAVEIVRRMARAIENASLYQERDFVARTLQQGLLPPVLPDVPNVEIEALFLPSERGRAICGDFYDVFETSDGQWAAVVGDVCGKGVEAATLTGMARHTLRAVADTEQPSEALEVLNRALLREELDGRFLTVAMLFIEPTGSSGARITIASAGHPLPQYLTKEGETHRVGEHGTLLGVIDDVRIKNVDVQLHPGDAIVVFTDGVIDKLEASGEEPRALLRSLHGRSWGSAVAIRDHIRSFIEDLGSERYDDIAVLVVRAR